MAGSEPFPLLNTSADQLHQLTNNDLNARRVRKSSGLGGEIRAGDTGAPALATSMAHLQSRTSKEPKETPHQHHNAPSKRFSKRRKARSMLRRARQFASKHTWFLPLVILAVFLSLYALNPTESNPIHHFIFLSYPLAPEPGSAPDAPIQYGKGLWDIALVSFYTVVLSFTREFIMQELLRPLARYCGMRTRGKQARFMEQTYMALYTGTLGAAGMYVMSRTPVWYFNTRGMYENFPCKAHEGMFKFYYLFQAAFWAQQTIVMLLGMEKPRKDFKELVGHHIISVALIALSYRFHFTYIGVAVYTTHDISDFFLATSKTLNYLDASFTGPYFFFFMCVWIYMRHYLNLKFLWSILTEFHTVGPYELNWETEQYKCLLSQVITFTLLALLQALNLFWLFFIIRIAYRFVVHKVAEDDRSEAEDESEEVDEQPALKPQLHETKKPAVVKSAPVMNGNVNGNGNGHAKLRLPG